MQNIYDVIPRFVNGDPLAVVEEATKHAHEANQTWCIFDVDQFSKEKILEALILAKKRRINVVCSNRSFEVFLVSHFKICDGNKSQSELNKEMEDYIKKRKGLKRYRYDKADEDILRKYFIPHIEEAITNAKTVYQRKTVSYPEKVDGLYPIYRSEWNSSTDVFRLVEALGVIPKRGLNKK